MNPIIDKLKICYTLSKTSKIQNLQNNPLDKYEV